MLSKLIAQYMTQISMTPKILILFSNPCLCPFSLITYISLLSEDGVCLLGVKCFKDHLLEVVFYHCLHVIYTCTWQGKKEMSGLIWNRTAVGIIYSAGWWLTANTWNNIVDHTNNHHSIKHHVLCCSPTCQDEPLRHQVGHLCHGLVVFWQHLNNLFRIPSSLEIPGTKVMSL